MTQPVDAVTLGQGLGLGAARREYVAQQFARALSACALYGPAHPTVRQASQEADDALRLLLEQETEFGLSLSNGRVVTDGRPVSLPKSHATHLLRACAAHGLSHLTFLRGLQAGEVGRFLLLLTTRFEELPEGGLAAALEEHAVCHIACGAPGAALARARPSASLPADASLLHTCTTALGVIQESSQHARVGRVLNASAARALASQLADNVLEDRTKLLGLLSIQRYDEYTFQHSLNICLLALSLGLAVGLDRTRLQELGLAALLHDVGKAWVPLEVLRKPGKLDEAEFALIRRHPVEGAVYLGQQLDLPPAAAVVAFQHHLRYDQNGYPKLRWPQPASVYSLIVGLADAYEALTSERPYRPTRGPQEALQVMLDTPPGQFEPRLLSVFAEMLHRSEVISP